MSRFGLGGIRAATRMKALQKAKFTKHITKAATAKRVAAKAVRVAAAAGRVSKVHAAMAKAAAFKAARR